LEFFPQAAENREIVIGNKTPIAQSARQYELQQGPRVIPVSSSFLAQTSVSMRPATNESS